jgi:hypothetical protein
MPYQESHQSATKAYLIDGRLQDVVAALQVMATNEERYSAPCRSWAKIISLGSEKDDAAHWKKVFDEHGEFFRRTGARDERYALVLRASKSFAKKFTDEKVTLSEWENMSGTEKRNYTKAPLADAELKLLIDMALAIHVNTFERHEIWRSWLPPLASFAGALLSAIIGFTAAFFKH